MEYRVATPTGERTISITIPDVPFVLWCSGGFDSTLLLHLLCREGIDSLTAINVARGGGTEEFSRAVCDKIGKRYGVQICYEQIVPRKGAADRQINDPVNYFRNCGITVMTGTTSNPEALPGGPDRPKKIVENVLLPFLHCDKSHTVALAEQLGLLDEIAMTSHSCTERNHAADRCGYCWQCRERAWAFALNDLQDAREQSLRS